MLLAVLAVSAGGQPPPPPAPPSVSDRPARAAEPVAVNVGQSRTVDTPWPVKRVAVTDPKIADVQVLTPRQILVLGKAVGTTDVTLWSETEEPRSLRVEVDSDFARIRTEIVDLFPQSRLEVAPSRGTLVVRGTVDTAEHAAELRRYLTASGAKYVDMTRVAGVQQVLLRVRVAEVSRTALRTLGFNAFGAGSNFFGASVIGSSSGPLNPVSIGAAKGAAAVHPVPFTFTSDLLVSPAVTLFGGFPNSDFQFFIQALAENQYMRLLAEPNLVTLSGEEAHFLAGGEFPIPVVQGTSAGGTAISVEYREFGVRLRFRPTVLGEGAIRLHVAPEVSELTDVGAVEIQGFRIPSLLSRKAEATLELKSGETFAMAGLISRSMSGRSSRVPFLGDIPVLGPLFRSVRYQSQETDLVVLVTPSLVEPMSCTKPPPTPGALHKNPNDWELYLEGRLEGNEPAKLAPADAACLKELGLTQLVGPGAWQSSSEGYARSLATLRPEPPRLDRRPAGAPEDRAADSPVDE